MKAIEQKKMVVCNKKSNVQNSYWQWFKSAILLGFFCMSALTSYFCLFSFSPRSNFSASSCIIHCQSSLAFSLREPIRSFVSGHFHTTSWSDCDEITYFSLSSDRWSTLSGFLLSARIFFFFSLSVCFFAPLRPSPCKTRLMVFDSLLLGTAAVVL